MQAVICLAVDEKSESNKTMNNQVEKNGNISEAEREYSSMILLRILRTVLCIFLVVIFCSTCALFEIDQLKNQSKLFNSEVTSETGKIRIYIDQGHNPSPYHNTGAEGNGLYEQDVTLSIGLLLAEILREDGHFDVCLSRPDENTVLGTDNSSSLKARVDGATDFMADYFISLHINSYTQDTVNGIEVYVSDKDSESYIFGRSLLQSLVDSTGLKDRGMKKNADFYVLKNATMPAVLLEMGFISNAKDAAMLSRQPELFAHGIYNGILNHFEPINTADFYVLWWITGVSVAGAAIILAVIFVIKRKQRNIDNNSLSLS